MSPTRNIFQSSLAAKFKVQRSHPRSDSSSTVGLGTVSSTSEVFHPSEIKTLDKAVETINKIINGDDTGYIIIPWKTFSKNWKNRAKVFCEFDILCLKNTRQHVGWAVCRHVVPGLCSVKNGTKRYNPKVGNSQFHRHIDFHNREEEAESKVLVCVPREDRKTLYEAAAKVFSLDNKSLNFCDNKSGMTAFASALVEIGQSYAQGSVIDVKDLLPSSETVRTAVIKLSEKYDNEFKLELPSILAAGGSVSCDGVKLESNGNKYFDFVINYLKCERQSIKEGGGFKWKICTRLIFLAQHTGSESAENIRATIQRDLLKTTGFNLSDFEKNFTFVTDCAAVMAKTFGASVSPRRIPFNERWIGCISHQINTTMKNVMESGPINSSEILKNFLLVKSIVATCKQSNINSQLPEGFRLIQDVSTRFGSSYDVVCRFLKSFQQLQGIVKAGSGDTFDKIQNYIDQLQVDGTDASSSFPALEAIKFVFAPLRHAQTELEASSRPTLMKVIPLLEDVKGKLICLSSGIISPTTLEAPHEMVQLLAKHTLTQLNEIVYHDLWCAACFLHPGLKTFNFCSRSVASNCRALGEALVRKIVSGTSESHPLGEERQGTFSNTSLQQPISGVGGTVGTSSWNLSMKMSFLTSCNQSSDEVSDYVSIVLNESDIKLLQNDDGIITFWLNRRSTFPKLHAFALRVFITFASSTASERDFSELKLSVPNGSSRLKDDVINAKLKVRSAERC